MYSTFILTLIFIIDRITNTSYNITLLKYINSRKYYIITVFLYLLLIEFERLECIVYYSVFLNSLRDKLYL